MLFFLKYNNLVIKSSYLLMGIFSVFIPPNGMWTSCRTGLSEYLQSKRVFLVAGPSPKWVSSSSSFPRSQESQLVLMGTCSPGYSLMANLEEQIDTYGFSAVIENITGKMGFFFTLSNQHFIPSSIWKNFFYAQYGSPTPCHC